ncbi:MAG: VCBS repeat-containing protein, partial [Verrucomicrobiales bacterium]|nr:VCBS repeat-containing protein [Verrucomicrobiales bacterium]
MKTTGTRPVHRVGYGCFAISGWLLVSQALAPAAVLFENRSAQLGVSGGNEACWFDFNNDGWVDICAGGKVYRNNGGESFTEIASPGACVAADFNNDGFVDLYSWSGRQIYRNTGGSGFQPIAMPALPTGSSIGAAWGDFNGDGFVDLYVGGYEAWPAETYADFILTNRNGTSFELTWSEVRYRARGVTACDFDRDADVDVYVSNYRLQPNILWRNQGDGTFGDVTGEYNALATSPGFGGGHSIGSCWGDFDEDGNVDLFAGNFAHQDGRGDQPKS